MVQQDFFKQQEIEDKKNTKQKDVKENYFSIITSLFLLVCVISPIIVWYFYFSNIESTLQNQYDNITSQIKVHQQNINKNQELYSLIESLLSYTRIVDKITTNKPTISTIIRELEYIIPDDWNIEQTLQISNNKSTTLKLTTYSLMGLLNFYNSLKNNKLFSFTGFDSITKSKTVSDSSWKNWITTDDLPPFSYSATFNLEYMGQTDIYNPILEKKTPEELNLEKKDDLVKSDYINKVSSSVWLFESKFQSYPCSKTSNSNSLLTLYPDGLSSDKQIEFTYLNPKSNGLLDLLKINFLSTSPGSLWISNFDQSPKGMQFYYLVDKSCNVASICTSVNSRQNIVDKDQLTLVSGTPYIEDESTWSTRNFWSGSSDIMLKDNVLKIDTIHQTTYKNKQGEQIRFFEDWLKTIIYKDLHSANGTISTEPLTLNYLCGNTFDNTTNTKTTNSISE